MFYFYKRGPRGEGLDIATDLNTPREVKVRTVEAAGMVRFYAPKRSAVQRGWPAKYDPDRCQKSAASRAVRKMREIARANRLQHFITLTFGAEVTVAAASKAWNAMMRKRTLSPDRTYIRVAEWGQPQIGLHFHLLADGTFTEFLRENWSYGFIDIKRVRFSDLDDVCRYMGKNFADVSRPYGRRYISSVGCAPLVQDFICWSTAEARDLARALAEAPQNYLEEWERDAPFGTFGEVLWDPQRSWR